MNRKEPELNLSDTVLGHVRKDATTLRSDQTLDEALNALRKQNLGERIVYFYVLDEQGRLAGVIPTRRLLMEDPGARVSSIMVTNVAALPETATLREAARTFLAKRYLSLPVVDSEGRLSGVLDATLFTKSVLDTEWRDVSRGEVFQLIGVHMSRTGSVGSSFMERFPWLISNVTGGIICALVAGRYEAFLDTTIILALFIPVVLALAESVGMQAMTLTVQGLTERRESVNWRRLGQTLFRELQVAFLLGLGCGGIVGGLAWLWKEDARAALAIGLSIDLSMMTACLLGVILPTLVSMTGRSPHIAAGPIVLTVADIATILFYFNISGMILG